MSNILITGVAGFLGSRLALHLQSLGHNITGIDNLSFGYMENLEGFNGKFIKDDIRNKDFHKYLDNIDFVYHFAAISSLPECQRNPAEAYSVNVGGWMNVLESCRRKRIWHVVLASTSAVYENTNATEPYKETNEVRPHLTYSLTKKHAEDMAFSYHRLYGMPVTTFRFFNLYGPNQDHYRASPPLTAYLLKCRIEGKQPILHAQGRQKRDYVYSDDACDLLTRALKNADGAGKIINVCSGITYSVYQLAQLFIPGCIPEYRPAPDLWNHYEELKEGYAIYPTIVEKETNKYSVGDPSLAEKIYGWKTTTSIEDGVAAMLKDAGCQ